MPVTLSVKLSSDTGNALSLGSDTGIFGTVPPTPPGGTYGYGIDLSQSVSGQAWWYSLPGVAANYTMTASAFFWPLVVTRPARLTGAVLNITTAGAGSTVRNALFGANAAGMPGTMINGNWFSLSGATAALTTATVDATTTLSAFTPYYVLTWVNTTNGYPTVTARSGASNMLYTVPRTALPATVTMYTTGLLTYVETAVGTWSALTAPPANTAASGANTGSFVPYYWLQLTNV